MNATIRKLLRVISLVISLGSLSAFMMLWSFMDHLTVWDTLFWGGIGYVAVFAGIAIGELLLTRFR